MDARPQESAALTARCLCGAVRISAPRALLDVHVRHCAMCWRWTGGPEFPVDCGPEIAVEGAEHVATYRSSDWAERAFCARCGSGLWWRAVNEGRIARDYILNAGLFDDQSRFHLAAEIFADERPDWYALAGTHRRVTGPDYLASIGVEDAAT